MFLILENGNILPFCDVIAMFDIDKITISKREREILNDLQKSCSLDTLDKLDFPRSLVIAENRNPVLTKFNLKTLINMRCLSAKFK